MQTYLWWDLLIWEDSYSISGLHSATFRISEEAQNSLRNSGDKKQP